MRDWSLDEIDRQAACRSDGSDLNRYSISSHGSAGCTCDATDEEISIVSQRACDDGTRVGARALRQSRGDCGFNCTKSTSKDGNRRLVSASSWLHLKQARSASRGSVGKSRVNRLAGDAISTDNDGYRTWSTRKRGTRHCGVGEGGRIRAQASAHGDFNVADDRSESSSNESDDLSSQSRRRTDTGDRRRDDDVESSGRNRTDVETSDVDKGQSELRRGMNDARKARVCQ